jgi:hypothetical protein
MELIIDISKERLMALDEYSKKENISKEEIVNKLIARYLLVKTMDKMRDDIQPKLKDLGINSEDDILKMK